MCGEEREFGAQRWSTSHQLCPSLPQVGLE